MDNLAMMAWQRPTQFLLLLCLLLVGGRGGMRRERGFPSMPPPLPHWQIIR
jgi:hypothetical protein